jgi:hypothetical protein
VNLNLSYLIKKLPKELYNNIVEECLKANIKNKEMISGLSGDFVPKHFYLENKTNLDDLKTFLKDIIIEYEEKFNYAKSIKILTKQADLIFDIPWINFQKKYEFVPIHMHDGVFSYSIWIKIPYDLKNEIKNSAFNTSFQFIYTDILGQIRTEKLFLSKEDEGKIIFFPSPLQHIVYPFYTSDDTRISISGNIKFLNN